MAGDPFLIHQQQQCVAVAIDPQFAQMLHLARGFAFAPQLSLGCG